MLRRPVAVFAALLALAAACSDPSSQPRPDDVFGDCTVRPGAVCRNQNLRNLSLASADLRGVDFSGSHLDQADLHNANLDRAKLVGVFLGEADLTGASLRDADLTKANLSFANFTRADLDGAKLTDAVRCEMTLPDGKVDLSTCPGEQSGTTTTLIPQRFSGPPAIEYFRATKPVQCRNDAAGAGIEVEWSMKNVLGLTFFVDDIRTVGSKAARGRTRVPFVCDGRPHTVAVQAYGLVPPAVNASFSLTLDPSRVAPDR